MDTVAIKLTHVTKQYIVHHEEHALGVNFVKVRNETFWALRNINLTIKRGERVGIIGPNGSGKTTLLKIIAGITTPTSGTVETNGKIVSLIDLEAGFHSDLTGEQNIYLNGMLLGMTNKEITRQLKNIIDFADIRQFIDAPLFTYSTGMKLRLGFAIAVHSNPDLLVLDEGMVAGDRDFQKKSQHKFNEFFSQRKTILMVMLGLDLIKNDCTRVVRFDTGSIVDDRPISPLPRYKNLNRTRRQKTP